MKHSTTRVRSTEPLNCIVAKASGGAGLGDRLFSLATAIAYAKSTGRSIWVDWRDRTYHTQSDNLFPYLFRLRNVSQLQHCPVSDSVVPQIWKGRLDQSVDAITALDLKQQGVTWTPPAPPKAILESSWKRCKFDFDSLSQPEEVVVISSSRSAAKLMSLINDQSSTHRWNSVHEFLLRTLSEELGFSEAVEQEVARFAACHFNDEPTIGMHIRYTNEAASVRSVPTISQYRRALGALLRKHPSAKVFLATDNQNVQKHFQTLLGSGSVCWHEKWLPTAGEPIHKNRDCPDGIQAARDAVVDIGILAQCNYQILTGHSSFSDIAVAFAKHKQQSYILPRASPLRRLTAILRKLAPS
ncbi:MAG: nodulation protein NodZ [Planctomycetaceae bacterium]